MLSFKQRSNALSALSVLTLTLILAACGGQDSKTAANSAIPSAAPTAPAAAPPAQAAPVSADTMVFSGRRQDYTITKVTNSGISGFIVSDTRAGGTTVTLASNITTVQFSDFHVNLGVGDKANSISATSLNSLIDLYVAFFNRVPDADGLAYWIDQMKAGLSDDQIADSFYLVALQSPALTGYASGMSNDDFIRIIYKNVLGRSGSTAPTALEIDYWSSQLTAGITKGHIVRAMLIAARAYVNDPTWSWVPALLNNKLNVANYFAVQQGLNYNSLDDNISKTMAIAAAVTISSTTAALDLIGVKDNNLNLASTLATPESLANICTVDGKKSWVRSHLDDVYLWYRDIIDVSPAQYGTAEDYFTALLVRSKDRFSFTSEQGSIDSYFQSGEDVSYGYSLVREGSKIRVRYVQPGSPADQAQIKRGTTLVSVDNAALGSYINDAQYNALYPSKSESHSFQVQDGSSTSRNVTMTAVTVTTTPVLQNQVLNVNGKKIGYMVFTDHIRTAESPLVSSIRKFQQSGIDDLVLDLRYNGGGYLYIANELSAMIGGSKVTNKIFEQLQFNDKHADMTADNVSYFYDTDSNNRFLPTLNLPRVFVITGSNTCSASESIINGLTPFMKVILIGDTTCGKPYGFIQTNNCNTAYFAIQFAGVNALAKGDYTNGFTPACYVPDDLNHELGNVSEYRLSAALTYATTGACPTIVAGVTGGVAAPPPAQFSPIVDKDPRPWRNIKLLK
ncbi:DUF4214 domain-containing protein [Undibacterium sp. Ji49W]|uniref:DUF4214 domain-containing protein n=1 Tax=Undibacterium sp. Ji49W TaxID=3413040 RepID=UPI003BF3E619